MIRWLFLFSLSVFTLSGCTSSIPVKYTPLSTATPLSEVSPQKITILPVQDERSEKRIVGYGYNTFGMKTADLYLREDIKLLLQQAVQDLFTAGHHQVAPDSDCRIQVSIKELWTEQTNHFSVIEFNTKMSVQVVLTKAGNTVYNSTKYLHTSSQAAIMTWAKIGVTFSKVVTEWIKELSRDNDFIKALKNNSTLYVT
jgi:uncharacterized lipoprotein YajG